MLYRLGRYEDAIAQCRTALAIDPDNVGACNNLGNALTKLKRLEEAQACYRRVIELEPDQANARSMSFGLSRQMCDWSRSETDRRALIDDIETDRLPIPPFGVVTAVDDPAFNSASRVATSRRRDLPVCPHSPPESATDMIGSVSPSLRRFSRARDGLSDSGTLRAAHAGGSTFSRFRGVADDGGSLRRPLERSFDRFIDVHDIPDLEVAREIQALEIDIAVDLNGFHEGAARHPGAPARAEVIYLGYPGTMGADFLDYIVSWFPTSSARPSGFYEEKIVFPARSYQPNDSLRRSPSGGHPRAEV